MINVDLLYPVGSIYLSIKSKNPGEIFGGVWERIAKGHTLVGVDENDTDFSSSEKIGGEKEHTLTIKELPGEVIGGLTENGAWATGCWNDYSTFAYAYTALQDSNNKETGGVHSQPHNNLQPYFTCYIFVRTA